jgi:hypothetical protein
MSQWMMQSRHLSCRYSRPLAIPRAIWYLVSQLRTPWPPLSNRCLSREPLGMCSYTRSRLVLWEQNPSSLIRFTCWTVPIVLTSARNCFSPCRTPSSFLTATSVASGSEPLNTDPKAPPPSFSEKFLVTNCRSRYVNAIRGPSTLLNDLILLHLRMKRVARPMAVTAATNPATASPMASFLVFPFPVPENSDAARRIQMLLPPPPPLVVS